MLRVRLIGNSCHALRVEFRAPHESAGSWFALPRRMPELHAELSDLVIAAAVEVHRALGPGLLESAYAECMALELVDRSVPFRREVSVPVIYKGRRIDHGFRADMIVDGKLLIELKCVSSILPVHHVQVATYLKLLSLDRGLLINFHGRRLVDGVRSVLTASRSAP